MLWLCLSLFFFFSSRRRHTRFDCDWSSDVCSSDLAPPPAPVTARGGAPLSLFALVVLLVILAWGAWRLAHLLQRVPAAAWGSAAGGGFLTLGRVLISTAIGTLWALPAGLASRRSRRPSRLLQPVVQIAASLPAPVVFPLVIALLQWAGISLGWGSILLMRSEEHTSELQSQSNLVCRLLLEKKKKQELA